MTRRRRIVQRHRGLDHRLLDAIHDDLEHDELALICDCDDPFPRPVGGIWDSVGAQDCGRCLRAYLEGI